MYQLTCDQCGCVFDSARRALRCSDECRTKANKLRCRKRYIEKHIPITSAERRRKHLHRAYRLTPDQVDRMLAEQDYKCAICKTPEPGGWGVFNIDHCHQTNTVRGLLCWSCNIGIGKFKDNISYLEAAVAYLKQEKYH